MWYNCGMKIKVFLAVLACKCCRSLIRLLGRGGTDFPGRVALKICPNLLGELAKGVTTVIVTGTNGKTTTSRMIEQIRRKPLERCDGGVRGPLEPDRQVPLYACAD